MKILRCCKLNLMQWRINPKYPAVFAFLALYLWFQLHGYVNFCQDMGYPVRPWLFPLLPGTTVAFMPMYLAFVLLISDAPFLNRQQQFVLQRVGKRTWAAGQLLYLFLTCVIYTAALWLLSWVFLLPVLEWKDGWGPLLTTVATESLHDGYRMMALDYGCMQNVTPIAATAWVASVMVGISFLMGEIMILCNLWLKKGVGAVVVSGFTLLPLIIQILFYKSSISALLWISPLSWLNRGLMGHTNRNLPSYSYAVGVTVGLSALLGVVLIATIHRLNLETDKE